MASKATERPATEQDAIERAGAAEKELEKAGSAGAKQETVSDISVVLADIKKIESMQDELDQQAEKDPDIAYTPEYQKKDRTLSRLLTKNVNVLASLYGQAKNEALEAKRTAAEAVAGTQAEKEEKQNREQLDATYKEVDSVDIPEFKLSKSVKDVEGEYIGWSDRVSMAFYGRPAANVAEKYAALEQLQLKNPQLVSKCQLMNVAVEPTEDIQRYMKLCEFVDFRDGYRKDPATGRYVRLMKYDTATRTQVPLVLPSLKAAIQQKRIEEGYFDKKADGAFQEGAESLAKAGMRRDKGAVELDTGGDQGQIPGGSQKWAADILVRIDEEEAMRKYHKGDRSLVDEINKARKILEMDPLVFED
jgi:hypothetical protein